MFTTEQERASGTKFNNKPLNKKHCTSRIMDASHIVALKEHVVHGYMASFHLFLSNLCVKKVWPLCQHNGLGASENGAQISHIESTLRPTTAMW